MKECSVCHELKPTTEYYAQAKAPDGLNYWCKSCGAKYRKEYADKNRKTINEKKRVYANKWKTEAMTVLGNACCVCGIDDLRVLEIDHIDGGGNQHRKRRSRESIWREIAIGETTSKFQLLCANCHRIKTFYPEPPSL